MNCPACGQLVADGARFCAACGTAVHADATAAGTVPKTDDDNTVLRQPRAPAEANRATAAAAPVMPAPAARASAMRRGVALGAAVTACLVVAGAVALWRAHQTAPTAEVAAAPAAGRASDADAQADAGKLWSQFDPAEVRAALRAFDQRIAVEEQEAARRTDRL